MNAVVIGAAKPGYAEAITRKLIKNGFKVIGTYDTEFEENATKLSKEFSSKTSGMHTSSFEFFEEKVSHNFSYSCVFVF